MKYKVGQIFYLVGAETAKVIPFRIVEEVTRTTLAGIETSFIAELPDEDQTKIDVNKLGGKVFDTKNDLRHYMIKNASEAIDAMIKNATKLSEKVYGEIKTEKPEKIENPEKSKQKRSSKKEENESVENKKEVVKVDIGNGVMATMNVSDLEKVNQV